MLETAPDGILLVDKPQGISSHRVVSIARRRLGLKKVGHAGTLDPMATGLLLLGIGPSTRLLTHLVGLGKTYTATIRLGVATDSDDADGSPTAALGTASADVSDAAVEAAVAAQRGEIAQVPSTVSAIKVDGRRAYDLARKGEDVVLKSRTVTVSQFDVTGRGDRVVTVDGADVAVVDLDVVVTCSSGTYVRALARDVGAALGTGAHLTALRRTHVGPFAVEDAVDLEDDDVDVRGALQRPADVARRLFPAVPLDAAAAKDLSDGKRVAAEHPDTDGPVAAVATDGDRLVGLVSVRRGLLRVITNFPDDVDRTRSERVIEWFMWVQLVIAVVAGLFAVVVGFVGWKPNDYTVGSLVLVELLLLAQGVISLVLPAVGSPPKGNALEFGVYAVSVLLVPPATIVWALIDRTKWSTVVLGAGAFTVAVMVYRMYQIWFALN